MVSRRLFLQASLSAVLAPRVTPAAGGIVVCRPYVQNVRRNRVSVRWMTQNPGEASVGFVSQNGDQRVVPASTTFLAPSKTGMEARFRHEAILTGLTPGTDYTYEVRLDGTNLGVEGLAFRTAGARAVPFLVVGDTGTGSAEQEKLAARMLREDPCLVLHTGDLAYPSGTYQIYERHYFDYYHGLMRRAPFYPTPGNHDYYEESGKPYFDLHDFPPETVPAAERGRYYTFEWADAQFFSIDSNDTLEAAAAGKSEMLGWLAREMEASRKFWRIAFFHHPPYASGAHDGDWSCELVRRHITPILERQAAPVAFCGHEHSYQRSIPLRGVTYITTGGGGAVLHEARQTAVTAAAISAHHYLRVEIKGRRMEVRAIGTDGGVLDFFTIEPPPALARTPVVNSASFQPVIGEGALISIFGRHLALETRDNAGRPLEDAAPELRISISGHPLPLLMVSPSQANAVLPAGLTGHVVIEVAAPAGTSRAEIEILPVAPALFPDSATPARAGATSQVFATGCSAWSGPVTVRLGRNTMAGSATAGELPGLSLLSFDVPSSIAPGVWPLTVEAAGLTSNAVSLVVAE